MSSARRGGANGQLRNLLQGQRGIAIQTPMLGGDFPCPVLKLPWRVGKNGAERSPAYERHELVPDGRKRIDRFSHDRIVLSSAALVSPLERGGVTTGTTRTVVD